MSTSYTVDIHCDRCGNWIHGKTANDYRGLATAAVKKAKAMGWSRDVRSVYTDLCPDCLIEHRKEKSP